MRFVRTPRRAAFALALAAAVLGGLVSSASADLTVKGDQAAWKEIQAAYAKLNGLQGYRMKGSLRGGSMIIEVGPGGNPMHMMMHTAGGNVESYTVNGQTRLKNDMPGAMPGWHCYGARGPMAGGPPDPSKIQGTVDVARGQDTAIDGEPVHSYLYTFEQGGRDFKATMYVGVQNGLPRRMVMATPQGDQTMDYYDYDAPIKFTVPACA
jgi:hypothetical protein